MDQYSVKNAYHMFKTWIVFSFYSCLCTSDDKLKLLFCDNSQLSYGTSKDLKTDGSVYAWTISSV